MDNAMTTTLQCIGLNNWNDAYCSGITLASQRHDYTVANVYAMYLPGVE